jgi:flagellin
MLSLINNLSSLNAQNNLNNSNNALSTALQRLSSGLRINSGADDPAGLVISQEQMAQMSGLQTAITNTSKDTNVVQIADGALNETNALLLQIRGLAIDAANTGANDPNTLAADQAQIANALQTITRIANSTQFGKDQLLNGSHAAGISTNVSTITASAGAALAAGTYSVNITTAATAANMTGNAAVNTTANAELLTINGVQISIAANSSENTMIADINAVTSQTGVVAMDSNSNGSGKITLYSTAFGSGHKITVSSTAGASSATGLTAAGTTSNDGVDMQASVTATPPANTGQPAVTNTYTGIGNVLTIDSGPAAGLTVTDGATNTVYSSATNNPYTANTGVINVETNNALTFQIGANAGQFANLTLLNMQAAAIGQNASTTIANLSLIDVTNANQSSSDILNVIDKAISDVSNLAGALGAFQDNTLQAMAANLQTSLQNTTAANSTIRDTNFASESAAYAQNQVLVQAGTQVLKNANQLPQLVLALLQ